MARKLDHVIIIDIEATCWEGNSPPPGQENEIIEIGICPLELSTCRRLEKRSLLVRPERSEISPFCTQLTTISPEMVAGAMTFAEACEILRKEYDTRNRLWASFGDYDRNQFQRQCESFKVPYPFGTSHLNVKTLFAVLRGLPHEVGMDGAIRMMGRELEGTHHRGHDDAWNIAGILAEILAGWKLP